MAMLRMVPRSPRSITAPELQKRLLGEGFKVEVRSIQRDLLKLSADYPLISDENSRPYRWSFRKDAPAFMVPAVDPSAALTFELARAYLMPVLPKRVMAHLEPHFEDAQKALRPERSALGKWPSRVRVINRGLSGARPEVDPSVLETVTEALLLEYQCDLDYQAREWPASKTIRVQPLGLVFRDPNVYLIGTIDGREGIRQLVLHRASGSELVEEQVSRPEDFDLDEYIREGNMGVLFSEEPIRLRLRCDRPMLNHLLEAPLGIDQQTPNISNDSFDLEVTLPDTQDLRWWLTAQASHLDILEPDWLRHKIRNSLQRGFKRLSTTSERHSV